MATKKKTTPARSRGRRVTAWMKKEQSQELIGAAVGGAAAPMLARQLASYMPAGVPSGAVIGAGGLVLAMKGRGLARGVGLALLAYGAQGVGEQLSTMLGTDESGALYGAGLPVAAMQALQQQAEARAQRYLRQADQSGYLAYDETGYLANAGGGFTL